MADLKFVVDVSDIHTLERELLGIQKSAKDSAAVFDREWKKAERALQTSAKAGQNYYNNLLKVSTSQKSAAQSAALFEKELVKQDKRISDLKLKYNSSYRAATQFKQGLRELAEAHESGAISSGRHEEQVERLKTEYRQFLSGTAGWSNQFVQGSNRAGKSLNKFGMYSQQFGYQMSDFLVQVQGGTNAFVAFGQQGAQLFGLISGPWGAALSIGAAAVGAFGAAWMKANNNIEDSIDHIKNVKESIAELNQQFKAMQFGVDVKELSFIEKVAEATEDLEEAQRQLNIRRRDALRQNEGESFWEREKEDVNDAKLALQQVNLEYQNFISKRAILEAADPLEAFGGEGYDVEAELQKRKDAHEAEWDLRIQLAQDYFTAHEEMLKQQRENQIEQAKIAADEAVRDMQAVFDATTFLLKVRFLEEESVFSQSLKPAGTMKPKQSYQELIGMGWTPEDLARIGLRTPRKGSGGGGRSKETEEDFLSRLQRELTLKESLISIYGEEEDIIKRVGKLKEQAHKKNLNISESELEAIVRKQVAVEEQLRKEEELYQTISSSVEDSLMSLVEGASSVEDAFKNMVLNIVRHIYETQVAKPLGNAISSGLTGLLGGGKNLLSATGKVSLPRAGITSNKVFSSNNEKVVIEQHFSFQANGDESVKRIIAQAAPKIAEMTKGKIMEARRRGGQMKAAFS